MTELIYVQMEVFSLLERYKDLDNVGDVITEQKCENKIHLLLEKTSQMEDDFRKLKNIFLK